METLTTALSTLSLNLIDSDSVSSAGTVEETTRRGPSSKVTRTYSNCSYTLVNTFRHTAECRATTLPAVRVKRPGAVVPTVLHTALLPPTSFRKVASGSPRDYLRPLGVRVQGACSPDNNVYDCRPEQAPMRTLKCQEKADTSSDEHSTEAGMEPGTQFSYRTQTATEHIRPSHPVIHHQDKDMRVVGHKPPSVLIGGNCNNYIRLHPPVGHKVASYV